MRRILLLCLTFWLVPALASPATKTVLVYGDSISAGYGVPRGQGWVDLLAQKLRKERFDYTVVNASLTGETSEGGARRIAGVLAAHRPALVVLELGGNDGLRGLPPALMRKNLEAIVEACRRAGARVLLVGMRLPPNYGTAYVEKFQHVFADVARERKLPVVPFLFEGFGENRAFFQADGIHPTAQAQPLMLETVWRVLRPMLRK